MKTRPAWLAAASILLVLSTAAAAQPYPARPVHMIVSSAPGGGSDSSVRALAHVVAPALGQPVLIENRAGANGNIGMDVCARAAPDGYTLCYLTGVALSLNPLTYSDIRYDVDRDFVPVIHVNYFESSIVASSTLPAKDMKELVALARQKPKSVYWGTIGFGSTSHLYLEWFQAKEGVTFTHVPYKGGAALLQAAIAHEVHAMSNTPGNVQPHVDAGKLRVIATLGRQRSKVVPAIPTLIEQGYDLDFLNWNAIFAPRGTPPEAIRRWNAEVNKPLADEAFEKKFFAPLGVSASGGTPQDLADILKRSRASAVDLAKMANLKRRAGGK